MKKIFIFIICFILVERFAFLQTDGFAIYKIYYPKDYIKNGENENDEIAKPILQQPFYYLGKGAQFFVFESEDGHHVLKLLKNPNYTPKFRLPHKTPPRRRIFKIVGSCQRAYRYLKEETALVAIHLQPDYTTKQPLQIYDKLGIAHTIDLNQTAYVIQKKASPLDEKKLTEQTIDSILLLVEKQFQRGVEDHDASFKNYGYVGDRLIKVDIGSFNSRPVDLSLKQALELGTLKIQQRMENEESAFSSYLKQKINEY